MQTKTSDGASSQQEGEGEGQEYASIPSPQGVPLLGNVFDIDPEAASKSCFDLARKFGEIFQMKVPGMVLIFVNSAALTTEVSSDDRFRKLIEGALIELKEHAVHNGLLTAETSDPAWKAAHHVAMPGLTPVKIRDMFDDMQDIVTQMCLKWTRQGSTHAIDVNKDLTRMALDVVGLCGFRYRFNSFYDSSDSHPIGMRLDRFLKEANARQWRIPFMNSLHIFKKKQFHADIDYMRALIHDLIARRRADGKEHHDLLDAFLKGSHPDTGAKIDDENLVDNLLTLLAAGHETTSGTLSFALYFLIQHPQSLIKAQQEVETVMTDGSVAVESLSKLPYLDAVLRETLRFYPTVPLFARTCDSDQVIGGKYLVKKATPIILNVCASQRDAAVYGDDVDEWKPERMLADNFKKLPIGAWRAFGTGIRACIGRAFAWQEMQIALAMLLYTFNFEAVNPEYDLQVRDGITRNPIGFEVRVNLRDENRYAILMKNARVQPDLALGGMHINGDKAKTAENKTMKVLYGSDNGMAQSLAHLFATHASRRGYKVDVNALNTAKENLPTDRPVVIFTSSYNGEPPLTAAQFVSWLESLTSDELKGVTYTVFGCGHRDWSRTFQRIPKLVDDLITEHGGTRIASLGFADASVGDTLSDFQDWEEQHLWPALSLNDDDDDDDSTATPYSNAAFDQNTIPGLMLPQQDFKTAYVSDIHVLTQPQTAKKMHMELTLPMDTSYRVGDYVVVAPVNPPHLVQRVLSRFGLAWDSDLMVTGKGATVEAGRSGGFIANDVLSNNVELAHPASARNIRYLAGLAKQESLRQALTESTDQNNEKTVLDILEDYPHLEITIQQYLSLLPPLQARTYSISSSPLTNPTKATLTWSVIERNGHSTTKNGGPNLGIASGYLAGLTTGLIIRHTIRSPRTNFTLPATNLESTPLIMVAAGSGIAPFRGFVQERHMLMQQGRKLGPAILFFGCRSRDLDDLYRSEFDEWQADGAVVVYRAFSRDSSSSSSAHATGAATKKKYVQDTLGEQERLVRDLWNEGARVYVCGAPKMAESVRVVIERIVGSLSDDDLANDRFLTEIFS